MRSFLSFISRFDDSTPIDNGDGQPINQQQLALLGQMRKNLGEILEPIHSDRFLARFLAAQNFNLDKGSEMLRKHLEWRKTVGADRSLDEITASVPETVRKYVPPPCFAGEDRDGYPVSFDFPGKLDADGICRACRVEEVSMFHGMVFMEHVYERLRQQSEKHNRLIDKFIVVQDMSGWSLRSMHKPLVNMVMETTHIRNANYPQILKKMVIINPPTIIGMCWSLIKPFLRERTRRKVSIVRGKPNEILAQLMAPSELPRMYDGNGQNPRLPPTEIPRDRYLAAQLPKDMVSVTVARGTSFEVTRALSRGDVVSWTFTSKNKDIGFGIHRQTPAGTIESVKTIERVAAHVLPQMGEITCNESGSYFFIFDNSHSILSSKTVSYSISVTTAPQGTDSKDHSGLEVCTCSPAESIPVCGDNANKVESIERAVGAIIGYLAIV
eukprot:gene7064-7644_t